MQCLMSSYRGVLSKGDDNLHRPMSFYRVFFPSAIMACHTRRHSTVLNANGVDGIPLPMSSDCVCCPKVIMACNALHIRLCVLPKDHAGIPRPTSSNRMCGPREMMACQAQRCPNIYSAQGPCMHATLYVIRLHVQFKGDNGMSRPTSSDCVCCLKAMMACYARRLPTECAALGHDCMQGPMLFDRVCCLIEMMACHARRCLIVYVFQRR